MLYFDIALWQLLLITFIVWFVGYIFGFTSGAAHGAVSIYRTITRRRRVKPLEIEILDAWEDMNPVEKNAAWQKADESLKKYYWESMTPEEQRRYSL